MKNEFEELQSALDEIKPPVGAKERMLGNIRAKAQASSANEPPLKKNSVVVELGAKSEEAMNADIKKHYLNLHLLWAVLPVAVCSVIVFMAVSRIIFINPSIENKAAKDEKISSLISVDSASTSETGDGEEIDYDRVSYVSPYEDVASPSELERLLNIPFAFPEKASEITCCSLENRVGYVFFYYNEHFFELAGSKEREFDNGEYGTLIDEEIIDSEFNAILSVYNSDGLMVNVVAWTDGANCYYLTNKDDCTKDEIMKAFFESIGK